MNRFSKIEKCTEILLAVLRYTNVKFDPKTPELYQQKLIKALRFQEKTDDLLFRSCIDAIDDAQFAINEFYKNGLGNNSNNLGVKYLRLYGVLNAYYIQLGAVIDLMKLFNFKNQEETIQTLKEHKLIEIRNKIGSHTTYYSSKFGSKEKNFYRISQFHLSQDEKAERLFIVGKNSSEEVNLSPLFLDFTKQIEAILTEIIEIAIFGKRTFKLENLEWMKEKYNEIRQL
jgi:hypothetical protein